jgi:hypothetical protein
MEKVKSNTSSEPLYACQKQLGSIALFFSLQGVLRFAQQNAKL